MILKKLANKFRQIFRRFFYHQIEDVIFKKSLKGEVYRIGNDRISAVEASRQQLDDFLTRSPQFQHFRSTATNFFDNNFRVTLALLDGEPMGYVWWTDAQKNSPECQHPHLHRYDLVLGDGDIWGFSLDFLQEHRGDGKASDFFQRYRNQLLEMGYAVLWGSAQKDNLPAMWLHRMHRYEQVKTIRSTLWFGRLLHVDIHGGRWYLKNGPNNPQQFDFRFLSGRQQ